MRLSFIPPKKQHQGLSLVELLVAMVIGLVVSLVVFRVLTDFEGRKRTTSSINDIDKVGIFTLHQLDQSIRSAGSGLLAGVRSSISTLDAIDHTLGCQINAARNGTTLLPAGAALPAPFANVPLNFRIAPVIILDGAAPAGDDIIITMSGNGGLAETATQFYEPPQSASLNLVNVAGFAANNLVLITQPPNTTISPCLIEQVSSAFIAKAGENALPLGGTFYQSSVNKIDMTSFGLSSHVLNLGASPSFQIFGVGANSTLFKYDLLKPADSSASTPNPAPFADSIYRMHALYGVYTTAGDPTTLTWVAPTGDYAADNLLAGTSAANALLANIKAIKVGIVMQAALPENPAKGNTGNNGNVSNSSITLFNDTNQNTRVTVTLSPQTQRYKALETVIPLRNGLMLK
jgi:type IV pilus assembly protein PilW